MSVSHEVAEVSDVVYPPEMPEPHPDFRCASMDEVVRTSNPYEREWKVVSEKQHSITLGHFMRERPIVALVLWNVIARDGCHIRHVRGEI
jgi:hypothetical protein